MSVACEALPDVAVIVILDTVADVSPPPPQPVVPPRVAANRTVQSPRARARRRARMSSQPPRLKASVTREACCSIAVLVAPAESVTVVEAGSVPEGVTVEGLKLQETPTGRPEQAKVTAALKPFNGVRLTFMVAGVNFERVMEFVFTETEKSDGGGVFTVMLTAAEVEAA